MRCPTLNKLPPPLPGRTGWPWTEEGPQLPDTMLDASLWPRVSIVTPSYNQGRFIEETIRSVLLQGYPDLEYMVVDGGSTDESVQIIRKYAPWLAFWVSEKDNGQSHAINKGWRRAQGDIIAYLNSDDRLEVGALRWVAETFLAQPGLAVVYGDRNMVNGKGQLIRQLTSWPYDRAQLMLADYIHQASTFVRRCALEQVGLIDESFHMCMDYDYWVRLAMAGLQMTYLPRPLSSTRLTADTKTASQGLRYLGETLRVLDWVYSHVELPEDVRQVRRAAYANAWRLGGVRYFDAGRRWLAIDAMFKSLSRNPWPGWRPLALGLAVIAQAVLGVHWRSARTEEAGAES